MTSTPERPYDVSLDERGRWYVRGPGDGMGLHGGTLWPETRFETQELAEQAAYCANTAYACGVKAAQDILRSAIFGALGVKPGHLNQLTLF